MPRSHRRQAQALKDARFPNADAYQMLAYCTAFGLKRGYLVYAKDAGEATRRHKMRNADVVIDVKAIDVQLEPDYLLANVAKLARELASSSAGAISIACAS